MRDRSGHKFEKEKDFDELRRLVRQLEPASSTMSERLIVKSVQLQSDERNDVLKRLKEQVRSLQKQLKSMQSSKSEGTDRSETENVRPQGPVKCYKCGKEGHVKSGCRNKPLNWMGSAAEARR
jgi:hypothetical protein